MAGRQMLMRIVLGAVSAGAACCGMAIQAAEDGAGETVSGILASKGETWIGVKPEGQDEAALYLPAWKGGLPRDGGGFDKETLALIKSLVVGSKVKLVWKTLEEHPRIVSVEVLAPPEKKVAAAAILEKGRGGAGGEEVKPKLPSEAEKPSAEAEKKKPVESEKADKPKVELGQKQNVAAGQVTAKAEGWIEIKEKDSPPQQFYARRLGGELGNFDRDMLKQMSKLKINDYVKVEWSFQDRYRVIRRLVSASQD